MKCYEWPGFPFGISVPRAPPSTAPIAQKRATPRKRKPHLRKFWCYLRRNQRGFVLIRHGFASLLRGFALLLCSSASLLRDFASLLCSFASLLRNFASLLRGFASLLRKFASLLKWFKSFFGFCFPFSSLIKQFSGFRAFFKKGFQWCYSVKNNAPRERSS